MTAIRQWVVSDCGASLHDVKRRADAAKTACVRLAAQFSGPDRPYSSVRIRIISPISANNMNGPHAARKGE